jgi:hypothetical protein
MEKHMDCKLFSSTNKNKTDHHGITEILLKVALNTINQTNKLLQKKRLAVRKLYY